MGEFRAVRVRSVCHVFFCPQNLQNCCNRYHVDAFHDHSNVARKQGMIPSSGLPPHAHGGPLSCFIRGFAGQQIAGSRSRGSGVFAAFDWEDMVLRSGLPIIGKATSKFDQGRVTDFPEEDRPALTRKLGHYAKVQSANSEDTVTWSVLGPDTAKHWLPDVLDKAFGPSHRPEQKFWRRETVMDTSPESDVSLTQSSWRYEIESKWLQDIGKGQGKKRNLTQLDLRAVCAKETTASAVRWGVLVIALPAHLYPCARKSESVFRQYFEPEGDSYRALARADALRCVAVTWIQVLDVLRQNPSCTPTAEYLEWRISIAGEQGKR